MEDKTINSDAVTQTKDFTFTGSGGEFFSIWIVNICLTIATLGIYSAWAKVRTKQYFYGNTLLDDVSFQYLAKPVQILKGRIIAFVAFMLYYVGSIISPLAAGVIMMVIVALVPALLVLSMAFTLRNSAYRNVRFDFNKDFKSAYKLFLIPVIVIGIYLVALATLMPEMTPTENQQPQKLPEHFWVFSLFPLVIALGYPWFEYAVTKFRVTNAKYGTAEFVFSATVGNYYSMYLAMIGIALVAGILFAILGGVASAGLSITSGSGGSTVMAMLYFVFITLFYVWIFAYIQTKRTNLLYGNINAGDTKLNSRLETGYMMYLYITNTLGIILTLGLFIPWAMVRTARYRASRTTLDTRQDLDSFAVGERKNQSALGEEVGEMFDLGLGV